MNARNGPMKVTMSVATGGPVLGRATPIIGSRTGSPSVVLGCQLGLPGVVLGRQLGLPGVVLGRKMVCTAWFWIFWLVCVAWQWVFHLFCSNANGGALFLLTDGAILMNECANGYGTRRWWKLTPDSTGGYVNGIWARVADSANGRKYVSSAVLADGRLLIIGGEYSDVSGTNAQDDAATGDL